jgi:hypothetical protein
MYEMRQTPSNDKLSLLDMRYQVGREEGRDSPKKGPQVEVEGLLQVDNEKTIELMYVGGLGQKCPARHFSTWLSTIVENG